jgi:hypothetical protein
VGGHEGEDSKTIGNRNMLRFVLSAELKRCNEVRGVRCTGENAEG